MHSVLFAIVLSNNIVVEQIEQNTSLVSLPKYTRFYWFRHIHIKEGIVYM